LKSLRYPKKNLNQKRLRLIYRSWEQVNLKSG
jgi:hypothetical protein